MSAVVNINGKEYTISERMRLSPEALSLLQEPFHCNGCGTNVVDKLPIKLIERWVGCRFFLACAIHDAEYEIITEDRNGDSEYQFIEKMDADSRLQLNVYELAKSHGVSRRKALVAARLFHSAVILFGHKSAGLS